MLAISNCSFIESQVLACPGRECLTFDPFTALMPHVGMIPRSAEAMPRLSGLPCVQFSKKVLSSPIWVKRDLWCGHYSWVVEDFLENLACFCFFRNLCGICSTVVVRSAPVQKTITLWARRRHPSVTFRLQPNLEFFEVAQACVGNHGKVVLPCSAVRVRSCETMRNPSLPIPDTLHFVCIRK